jgi:hypothetical protein
MPVVDVAKLAHDMRLRVGSAQDAFERQHLPEKFS